MADGKDYVAKVEITWKDGSVVAAAGETCERVDPNALGWLEQCGAIERVATEPVAAETTADPSEG